MRSVGAALACTLSESAMGVCGDNIKYVYGETYGIDISLYRHIAVFADRLKDEESLQVAASRCGCAVQRAAFLFRHISLHWLGVCIHAVLKLNATARTQNNGFYKQNEDRNETLSDSTSTRRHVTTRL